MTENNVIFETLDNNFFTSRKLKFSCVHMNIRSLRQNFDLFLANLAKLDYEIDLIVLSEIWIFEEEVSFYKIPGYTSYANCNNNFRSGGIIVFALNKIKVKNRFIKMQSADILVLEMKIENVVYSIFSVYRLQKFSEDIFIQELETILSKLTTNIIFLGDINICIKKTKPEVEKYLSLMYNNGFSSFINNYTRVTEDSSSCLDHIFIRHKELSRFESGIFQLEITDHSLTALIIKDTSKNLIDKNVCNSVIKYNTFNFQSVKGLLKSCNWNNVLNKYNVNIALEEFYTNIKEALEISKETKEITPKYQKAKFKSPWMNDFLFKQIEKRNKLARLRKKRPYDREFNIYFNNFVNRLSLDISHTKNQYYSNLFDKCNGNSSEQWKLVNSLTDKRDKQPITSIQDSDGNNVEDPQQLANMFNEYFINIPLSLVADLPDTGVDPSGCVYQVNSLFLYPVSEQEILKIINSLKNKKSVGCDSLSVELLKEIAPEISHALVHLINTSFSTGEFPIKLKQSIIVPIFKKDRRDLLQNYRPIALLSVLSKVFERAMKSRLLEFLNKQNFFSSKQFGFMQGKSTELAITYFTEGVYNSFNNNDKSSGIFIDFTKAFDLVDHKILLGKLEIAGIRGTPLNWFRTYLTGRSQQVRIQKHLSSPKTISKGVPQGSVLSAPLFLIFINSLLNTPMRGSISAFADDISIRYSSKNWITIWTDLNEDLKSVRKWCDSNKMIINAAKTKLINFDLRGYTFDSDLRFHVDNGCLTDNQTCDCAAIEQVDNIKYLGIYLDEKLSWKNHISQLKSQLRKSVRQFYFLRNMLNENLMRTLYFALIDSRLNYGIENWGGTDKVSIHPLIVTQNHFIRILKFKPKRESALPLYTQLKILPLTHLFVYKVLKVFYNRSGNYGVERTYNRTRSSTQGLFIHPKVNKSIFKKSFLFLGPKIYNKIPSFIKNNNNSCKQFLCKVRKWLFTRDDLSDLLTVLS